MLLSQVAMWKLQFTVHAAVASETDGRAAGGSRFLRGPEIGSGYHWTPRRAVPSALGRISGQISRDAKPLGGSVNRQTDPASSSIRQLDSKKDRNPAMDAVLLLFPCDPSESFRLLLAPANPSRGLGGGLHGLARKLEATLVPLLP